MASYFLDIEKGIDPPVNERLHVGDNGLRQFVFHVVKGGDPFPLPEGCVATLFALLPDGTTVYDFCETDGDTVIYTVKGGTQEVSLTSVAGEAQCEIRLTGAEGEVLTVSAFTVEIDPVLQNDNAVEAQSSFSALTDALTRVLDAESGLSSKVDKVEGTEGNVVVFAKDGGLADGNRPATSRAYHIPYYSSPSAEQKAEILDIVERIRADTGEYTVSLVIQDGEGYILPANYYVLDTGRVNITATYRGFMMAEHAVQFSIQVTAAGDVRCFSEELPSAYPNPAALTFTGLTEGIYDGSSAMSVEIPATRPFRFIRKVTIPEDITTDTSGVNFAEQTSGGYTFAFDTDEDGNAFAVTDLLIYSYAGSTHASPQYLSIGIDRVIPQYAVPIVGVSTFIQVAKTGSKAHSAGWSFQTDDADSFSFGATFGGGSYNNLYSSARPGKGIYHDPSRHTPICKIYGFLGNLAAYGFEPGSTFTFYGR